MELTIEQIQEQCRLAITGKPGVTESISKEAGCSKQTVRNALTRENVLQLTELEKKVLLIASRYAKEAIQKAEDLKEQLNKALQ